MCLDFSNGECRGRAGRPLGALCCGSAPPTVTPVSPSQSLLEEAAKIVAGERLEKYGPAERDLDNIAKVWSVILAADISAADVALCMIGLKVVRHAWGRGHDDLVDIAGYAALAAELEEV